MCFIWSIRFLKMNLESISLAEAIMADADVELKKKRTFRKFTYRGSTLTSSLTWTTSSWWSCLSAGSGGSSPRGSRGSPWPWSRSCGKRRRRLPPREARWSRDPPQMIGHYLGEFSISSKPTPPNPIFSLPLSTLPTRFKFRFSSLNQSFPPLSRCIWRQKLTLSILINLVNFKFDAFVKTSKSDEFDKNVFMIFDENQ